MTPRHFLAQGFLKIGFFLFYRSDDNSWKKLICSLQVQKYCFFIHNIHSESFFFFNICPELFRTFLFLVSGHEEKAQTCVEHGDNSLSEQSILLDTPFFQIFSPGSCFSAGASPRFGFPPVEARKEWCFHLLHGPWQAGLRQLRFHLDSETEGGRSPVWALKGKDHLIVQISNLPSEREDMKDFYAHNSLEARQCLRADQRQPQSSTGAVVLHLCGNKRKTYAILAPHPSLKHSQG